MNIAVVVLNWNGITDTEKCVESLVTQTYKSFKILIVDNGSSDDSISRLKQLRETYPEKIILQIEPKNLGFAGGVNVGINYALKNNYDAVALFNNDAVADKNWLKNLVIALELNPDISITTGCLVHANGKTIDSTGDFYSIWGIGFPRDRNISSAKASKAGYVFGASGGASLYKTSLFKEIGLFDESFFAYYEDADISFRTQLAGRKVYYTKDAIAYHEQGASSSKIPGFTVYQTFKNLPLLFWKNTPLFLLHKIGFRFLLLYILIFINAVKKGSGWPALKGISTSIYYFWTSALWSRIKVQRMRKVSTRYIWSILYHDLPPEQTGMRKFRKIFTGKE